MADIKDTIRIEFEVVEGNAKQSVDDVESSISKLNNTISNTKTTSNNLGSLSSQLENLKLPTDLTSSFYKLRTTINDGVKVTETYVTKNNQIITVTKKLGSESDNTRVKLKQMHDEVKRGNSLFSTIKNSITSVLGKVGVAAAGLIGLNKSFDIIQKAMDYEEAKNLFMATLGDKAEEATKWVEKMSNALYIDDSGLMQYLGSLNSLIKGLGVGADKSYLMSKNLTQLVYDLASFKNLDFETAFRKIQSGVSGEIEPLTLVAIICEYYRKCSEPTNVGCDNYCYC